MSTPLILPPGISKDKFAAYLDAARAAVGADNVEVITGPHQFTKDDYMDPAKEHDMYPVFDKDYFVSSAVVCPRNVQEVQALMRISNEHKVPVWPFSIGRNIGYGGAAPRVPGSVGIDMGRHMNRVLEVNEADAYCLLEPGVTFQGLYDHLVANGLEDKLWIDVPDLGGGSVIGNTIERGVGYSPYGDHFMMHCGMEIVLPNGELVRTGMGALPEPGATGAPDQQQPNRCWQLFNYGFGPYHDGIFSQSNYGIVTKMGLWLMPNPGGYQAYSITFEREQDLPAIVETIRQLRITMVIQNVATIRSLLLDAAVLGDKQSFFPGVTRPLNDTELDEIQSKLGLGRWIFYGALYGPQPVRDALWGAIHGAFSQIPGAKFFLHEDDKRSPGVLDIRAKTMRGVPTFDELKWVDWVPNGAHFFFSPIAEVRGEAATRQFQITKKRLLEHGFDVIVDFIIGMREMHHIVCVVYDRTRPEERARALTVVRQLIDECAANGWGEYRTHLALMDQIAGTYSFNDGALMRLSERIKDTLDPNGILAPGKNGVWPRGYDKDKWQLGAGSEVTRQSIPKHPGPEGKL
ncbi:FAD-linked oxidase-like protein [Cutaneotrichosporon oleaginosum]|uniref:FAD-linked oxidase-like protein n=1 Tax=Cutaneotrichosporon oleaginosum TaxID=879819 RepID=A0A0J0XXF2_9TREE|nr:FAD-linked oxidase-like protein [Cutaneotrichosporon oleaginosum]KLT45718.1 FAD-linked oxidase-like protein [Cutaneotrichosporon oleaginosum]TXT04513.1 hypothetical protein COLE_07332 [Cutaneotrichosporon oleaginosum]